MQTSKRGLLSGALAVVGMSTALAAQPAAAADWRDEYSTISIGVITSENEADRITRYEPVLAYFEDTLGVDVEWRSATDYAGVIEALKADKVELAYLGPAAYAQAWIVMNGEVVPLAGDLDSDGDFGYHSVVVVREDSPYQTIEDLEGKKLAFADPNSTSGYQAPRFFLREAGYDADEFFGQTAFSGSHENSIIALLNGTFDAAATWWNSEERSNFARMAEKGMIEPDQLRVIWKSPRLPSSPWTVSSDLPEGMRQDIQAALMNMPEKDPEAWQSLHGGASSGFRKVTHEDYEAIVRMIQANLRERRES